MLLVLFALLLQILLISILIVVFVKLCTCHEVLYLILILSVLLILQIFLIIIYCIYKAILAFLYCIYKFYKFMIFFYYTFSSYFYIRYRHFAYKISPSVTNTIIICLFVILLIYLYFNLDNKIDPTGFIYFIIFIFIIMLSCCFILILLFLFIIQIILIIMLTLIQFIYRFHKFIIVFCCIFVFFVRFIFIIILFYCFILILLVPLIIQIILIIIYFIYKTILALLHYIHKFIIFFCDSILPYYYIRYRSLLHKTFAIFKVISYLSIFLIFLFYFFFSNLDNGIDPTGFMAFVIFICIIMLSCCLIFILVIILLGNLFELVKYLFQSICFLIGQFYETISHNNFSRVKHFFLPLYNLLLSFFDIISKIISTLRTKAYGYRFVCHLLNYLTRFSVLFYKDLVGNILKQIMLIILEVVGGNIISVYILVYLFYTIIKVSLVFLLTKLVSFLSYIRSTNIYIFTFGHIEGYIYRFWIYYLKDIFSNLVLSSRSLYFVEAEKVGLFLVIVNIVGIFIALISIFYSSSIYIFTIGLHMDVCFRFILNRCDGISFVLFFILFSFTILYVFSIIFFISCIFATIILFLRLYYFTLILFDKLHVYFLSVQGNYFHFRDYLIRGANKLDTSYIKSSWDKIDDVFKYDELFRNKVLEIQEDRLDNEEEKKDPNKFYYKRLFVNLVAILSFTFVFVIMFISYVYF